MAKARPSSGPTGQGGKGNEGVAAYVGQLKNSIGYVEYAYAKQNKLAWTQLQNKAGKFVQPEQKASPPRPPTPTGRARPAWAWC